jgi:hypothetical protein
MQFKYADTFKQVTELTKSLLTSLLIYFPGFCGNNGANCTTFDVTLENGASSANLDLTPP